MCRLRVVSALIAMIVMVVVAIVLGVFLASYVLGYMTEYTRPKHLVVDEAKYFYFVRKPSFILNKCTSPPCGLILMHVYAGEKIVITQARIGSYTWDMNSCSWRTTTAGQLDVGDNIILLRNPKYNPPCIVVSREGNPTLYNWYSNILAKNGDLSLLNFVERTIVLKYSDLRISNPSTPQWLNIITKREVYQVLVHPVLLR